MSDLSNTSQDILNLLPNNGTTLSGTQIKSTLALRDLEYQEAKHQLKECGLVVLGRGRGGTMALATPGTGSDTETKIVSVSQNALDNVWREVERRIEEYHCKCDIGPGMSYDELIALEEGCTGSRQKGFSPGWVCDVLDYYRRQIYKLTKPRNNED